MKPQILDILTYGIAAVAATMLFVRKLRWGVALAASIFLLLGIYYYLSGQAFLAASQWIIYMGGILILWLWAFIDEKVYSSPKEYALAFLIAILGGYPWLQAPPAEVFSFSVREIGLYWIQDPEGFTIFLALTFAVVGVILAIALLWEISKDIKML